VVQDSLGKKRDTIFKLTRVKRTEGLAQVVQHLPSTLKAKFKPQYYKKKKKERERESRHLLETGIIQGNQLRKILQSNGCRTNYKKTCYPLSLKVS
jgi:hypothetical protein